jgi:hypothetical protein
MAKKRHKQVWRVLVPALAAAAAVAQLVVAVMAVCH